jgi:hypothetical protein
VGAELGEIEILLAAEISAGFFAVSRIDVPVTPGIKFWVPMMLGLGYCIAIGR